MAAITSDTPLAQLCRRRGVTFTALAREMGWQTATLARYARPRGDRNRRDPPPERAAALVAWSGGELSLAEIYDLPALPAEAAE